MRWIVAFLLLAVVAFAQSSKSQNIQNSPRAQEKSNTQQPNTKPSAKAIRPLIAPSDQKKSKTDGGERTEKWHNGWTLSDKIAAIASAFAFFQFLVLIATVVVMRRTARQQLRAYIANPIVTKIERFDTPFPKIFLGFKNSGQTPAHEVKLFTDSAMAAYPLLERPTPSTDNPDAGSFIGIVGPGADFHCEVVSDIPVTDIERKSAIAGKMAFYTYGEISYRDSFGRDRTTTFCVFYHGDSCAYPSGKLATYHKWNNAT